MSPTMLLAIWAVAGPVLVGVVTYGASRLHEGIVIDGAVKAEATRQAAECTLNLARQASIFETNSRGSVDTASAAVDLVRPVLVPSDVEAACKADDACREKGAP